MKTSVRIVGTEAPADEHYVRSCLWAKSAAWVRFKDVEMLCSDAMERRNGLCLICQPVLFEHARLQKMIIIDPLQWRVYHGDKTRVH